MSQALTGHTHDLLLLSGVTATEAVACDGAALNFGKNAATNRTIAGANSATKGGVVAYAGTAAAGLCEFTDATVLGGTSLVIYWDAIGV